MYHFAMKTSNVDRPSQQDVPRVIWDRLPIRHKNNLKATLNVHIYSRKDNFKFLNSIMTINPENPTILTYYYLTQKQNVVSLDLLRIYKKNGLIWNEEALMCIKNDKKISAAAKSKLRSDIIMLLKEDDNLEVFIVFSNKEEMAQWSSSLKNYLGQFKEFENAKNSVQKGASGRFPLQTIRQNGQRRKTKPVVYDLEPYLKQSRAIDKIKTQMKLFRILVEQEDKGEFVINLEQRLTVFEDSPYKFKLHLSENGRENCRVYTIQVAPEKYFANKKQTMTAILKDISPLAYLDKETIKECIHGTLQNITFREKLDKVNHLLEENTNIANPPCSERSERLLDVAEQLKALQAESEKEAASTSSDLHTQLFHMLMGAKLGYAIENYETLANLQEVKSASFISLQPLEEDDGYERIATENSTRKTSTFPILPQKDPFKTQEKQDKRSCDSCSICNIF